MARLRAFAIITVLGLALSLRAQAQADSIPRIGHSGTGIGKRNLGRTAAYFGVGIALRLATDQLLKNNVRELRPDGSDYRSFPSRHSTWAYGLAGTFGYALGSSSPWWTAGAHTAANVVGFQRVMSRRHYPGDVLAGAGIGLGLDALSELIASAIFGRVNPYAGWKNIGNGFNSSFSVSTGASFPWSSEYGDLKVGTALMSTFRASFPAADWAGFSVSASILSSPVKAKGERICMRPLNSIRIGLGPSVHYQLGESSFAIGARAEGGYMANLHARGYKANSGSAYASVEATASMMLTKRLSVGVDAGIAACKLSLNGEGKKTMSAQTAIYTKVVF